MNIKALTGQHMAAIQLLAQGTSKSEVARRLEVDRNTVIRWCKSELFDRELEGQKALLRACAAPRNTEAPDNLEALILGCEKAMLLALEAGEAGVFKDFAQGYKTLRQSRREDAGSRLAGRTGGAGPGEKKQRKNPETSKAGATAVADLFGEGDQTDA